MKPKKTFKSLDELSADSIGIIDTNPEKTKPQEPDLGTQTLRNPLPDSFQQFADARGYRSWGINE